MSRRLTKYSAVAAVAAVVVLGFTFIEGKNKKTGKVWAMEQTIAAMQAISSVHAYCTDWDGSQSEVWVKTDPDTGREEYYCADQDALHIVGTPKATYYYHKDKNLVRIRKGYVPASEVRFPRLMEDIAGWVKSNNGQVDFSSEYDPALHHDVIVVRVAVPAGGDRSEKALTIKVDSETKLPIGMEATKGRSQEGVKSIDRLEYNLAIPEGVFDFKIPDGAKVVYE